jgi:hypothetical protein
MIIFNRILLATDGSPVIERQILYAHDIYFMHQYAAQPHRHRMCQKVKADTRGRAH